jgi:hypothetical protein
MPDDVIAYVTRWRCRGAVRLVTACRISMMFGIGAVDVILAVPDMK